MEWNIVYCIIDTLFNDESQIKEDIGNKNYYIEVIKRRIRVVAAFNFMFMPVIFIWIVLYNLFNYGENFYNNPVNLVKRNWTRIAHWKFRNYNELIDIYDDRLKKSNNIANSYSNNFRI